MYDDDSMSQVGGQTVFRIRRLSVPVQSGTLFNDSMSLSQNKLCQELGLQGIFEYSIDIR